MGIGIPGGCKANIHSVSDVLEDNSIPPEHKHILLVDLSNAFNSVSRQILFEEVRSQIPSLSAWMEYSYGTQLILLLNNQLILGCSGFHQGDPLGLLGFSLALHPIVNKIKEQVPGLVINAWYLDDGTLCGSPVHLARALSIIESGCPSHAKSLIYTPSTCSVSHPLLVIFPPLLNGSPSWVS